MRSALGPIGLVVVLVLAGCARSSSPVGRGSSTASGLTSTSSVDQQHRNATARLLVSGEVVSLDASGSPRVARREFVIYPVAPGDARVDTVPAYSSVERFQWRGGLHLHDVAEWNSTAPEQWGRRGGGEVLTPGLHTITQPTPGRADSGVVTFRIFAGYAPTTWWAGPDPARWPLASDGDGRGIDVTSWAPFATSGTWPPDGHAWFAPDSFRYRPVQRRPLPGGAATFYEVFGNRLYARAQGDSVHVGSWVVLCNGGFDRDSRYTPRVAAGDPSLPPGYASQPGAYAAVIPAGLVGSPIGFRGQMLEKLADGSVLRSSQTTLYPTFDVGSVFFVPQIAGYWPMRVPGKVYLVVAAEDADGFLDTPIADPVALADRVDAGGGSPADRALRGRILTFTVRATTFGSLAQHTQRHH